MTYIWEGSSDLIKNIDGPDDELDNFFNQYKHYVVKGGYDKMDKLIAGLIFAYQAIKPPNQTIPDTDNENDWHKFYYRPVYLIWKKKPCANLVWREKPGEKLPIDDEKHSDQRYEQKLCTDCFFNIYTENIYHEMQL